MKHYSIHDVVIGLIGPVKPKGDESVDGERLENLRELTELVDKLITDIDEIAFDHAYSKEESRKRAGQHCKNFLTTWGLKNETSYEAVPSWHGNTTGSR